MFGCLIFGGHFKILDYAYSVFDEMFGLKAVGLIYVTIPLLSSIFRFMLLIRLCG